VIKQCLLLRFLRRQLTRLLGCFLRLGERKSRIPIRQDPHVAVKVCWMDTAKKIFLDRFGLDFYAYATCPKIGSAGPRVESTQFDKSLARIVLRRPFCSAWK
jgi:hypothetical protein